MDAVLTKIEELNRRMTRTEERVDELEEKVNSLDKAQTANVEQLKYIGKAIEEIKLSLQENSRETKKIYETISTMRESSGNVAKSLWIDLIKFILLAGAAVITGIMFKQ